jgi:hypothetical protein
VSPGRAGGLSRPLAWVRAAWLRPLLLAAVAWAIASGAEGQIPDTVPPPRDTVAPIPAGPPFDTVPPPPTDTIRPPVADTVPADTVPADTLPPPALVSMDRPGRPGWTAGIWEWSREDLLRLPDISLLQLLERIPGITSVRATAVGQPEGAAVFGAGAGAVRYEVDGFALDPLTTATFDPSRLPLVALASVRVERRLTGAVVRIEMVDPADPQAHSIVEAATGDYQTNLFRGTFLAPSVLGGALALGFESLGSQILPSGSTNLLGGWARWTWAGETTGIQLEYRQADMTRSAVGDPLSGSRRDWVARARARLGPIAAEAYAGASAVDDELGAVTLREGTPQAGVRLRSAADGPIPLEAMAALRLRDHPRLPGQELDAALWAYPAQWLAVGAEVTHGRWETGDPTGSLAIHARAGPVLGLSATAGLFRSDERQVAIQRGAVDPEPMPGSGDLAWRREGIRLGGEFQRGTLLLAGAALRVTSGLEPGFGLPFDQGATAFGGGEANGFEAMARLPTGWRPLRLEGWYVGMDLPEPWPYLPADQWNAALVYHDVPLPSGNLEIYLRAEHVMRGAMSVPTAEGLAPVEAYQASNLELTIRVMTVRAFIRWQNVLNRFFQEDLPGFTRPGQHIIYGVKWEFWN